MFWSKLQRQLINHIRPVFANLYATSSGSRNLIDKKLQITKMRNVGIIAHIDAGKTTTTERMLYYSGYSRTIGEVHDGDTVMDYMQQERDRGITIASAAISFHWNEHRINLIDTPGHVDFTVEVERALRVLDGAIVVLDAVAGIEAQTLSVWRQADRYNVPRIAFANKMDRKGANLDLTIRSMREKLNITPLVTQIPLEEGQNFSGVVDLPSMQLITWNITEYEDGSVFNNRDITKADGSVWERTQRARSELIEQLADLDDAFMAILLEERNCDYSLVSANEIISTIARVTGNARAIPILCGSALKNKGIQPLLDRVVDFLPSPEAKNKQLADSFNGNLCAYAFKVLYDRQRGPLVFLRIYSGSLQSRQSIYNVNRGYQEKINRLLLAFADDFEEIKTGFVGNIVVAVGLKQTVTGDTLISSAAALAAAKRKAKREGKNVTDSFMLTNIKIPEPVFFCTIEPQSATEQKALDHALSCLQLEDPSFKVSYNQDTGQLILSGMGELHLDVIANRIKQEYNVAAELGPLQVSYRETITSVTTETVQLDRIINGKRHSATVTLRIEPSHDSDPVCCQREENLSITDELYDAIQNSIQTTCSQGPILHFPIIGVTVTIVNCKVQTGTSASIVAACASSCLLKIFTSSDSRLLEPMMKLEVRCFDEYLASVLGDLSHHRRATINEVSDRDNYKIVFAEAPLETLVGYVTTLRSMTSGTADCTMEYSKHVMLTLQQQNDIKSKRGL